MEKLPETQHAIMALFMQDDKVRDVTFAESMHTIDDIRQLHKLGLLEDPDKQWGRYIAITEAGDDYRRAFFPTKDERIADLRAEKVTLEELLWMGIYIAKSRGFLISEHQKWVERAEKALGKLPLNEKLPDWCKVTYPSGKIKFGALLAEAARAYDTKAKEVHGEFAKTNFD